MSTPYSSRRKAGFTLIEVMIVVSIISLLTGAITVSLRAVKVKTQATQAITDLQKIALYIETYRANYGAYPLSCGTGNAWATRPANGNGWCALGACWISQFSGEGWCPLPYNRNDPPSGVNADTSQYIYRTNGTGTEYKLIYYQPVSIAVPSEFLDPQRPTWAFGIWSPGGAGF